MAQVFKFFPRRASVRLRARPVVGKVARTRRYRAGNRGRQPAVAIKLVWTTTFAPINAALYSGPYSYFFSGDHYARVPLGPNGPPGAIDAGYPRPISDWNWPNNFGSKGITGAGSAGGALGFLGLPYLAMATDNGNGVTLIDTANPATPTTLLAAPTPF